MKITGEVHVEAFIVATDIIGAVKNLQADAYVYETEREARSSYAYDTGDHAKIFKVNMKFAEV